MTGQPQVQINYQTVQEKEHTLQSLFNFLENQNVTIVIAIDEFQQISNCPEKNIEALLRTNIQRLSNIRFIFLSQYNIGTPANARRISRSLLEKELLLEMPSKKETSYRVYDVFLLRWLEMEY